MGEIKNIPCKVSKPWLGEGQGFTKADDHRLLINDSDIAAALTARYYKGASANGDNIVLVVDYH